MTRGDTKTVKAFLLLLVFFAGIMLLFFYTARKNTTDSVQVIVPSQVKQASMLEWDDLRNLNDAERVEVRVNGASVIAEMVRSDAQRQQGLSGREGLAENEGMLFIFDQQDAYSFWNKDMKFPIDVLWMDHSEVVGVSSLPIYDGQAPAVITAPTPVSVVLEVPEGFAQRHNIMVGNIINIYETK
ncbi:MAG: DUF192 domain-containing protein [Candidatus Azambacteria bacterium]|nr:DUF192 domain-containing protein [Candidatus Azambacteria bacterium]